MHQTILNAQRAMQKLPFAAVVDVAGFYDHLPWSVIDKVIDDLPADEKVRDLLRALVRVEIIERRSGLRVPRAAGIAQGLSVSPVLANLALNDFDQYVGHAVSKHGASVRRFCDDILLLAQSANALRRVHDVVSDRLAKLGLKIKTGTGNIVDTRTDAITWLGISFNGNGLEVPAEIIGFKAAELQDRIGQEIVDPLGIQDVLRGLHEHYRRILPSEKVQEAITSIKERLDLTNPPLPRKEATEHLRELIDDRHHRGPSTSGTNAGGKPDGDDDHRGERTTQESEQDDQGGPSIGSRLAAPMASSSGAWDPGAPAQSAPEVLENPQSAWRIGAVARGPRRAVLVARPVGSDRREQWCVDLPTSASRPEAVLLALANALVCVRDRGATTVTVVVTDVTLDGYLRRGWHPRSLSMHRAIKLFTDTTEGLAVTFERARTLVGTRHRLETFL